MLEQAISDLTAAVKELTAAIKSTNAAPAPVPAPAPKAEKPKTEKPKAEPAKDEPKLHDSDTPLYFHNETHNSVYRVLKGEPVIVMRGAVEIDEATFVRLQGEYAKKFAATGSASSPSSAATDQQPTAQPETPSASTYEEARAALMALAKATADGRDKVKAILAKVGVNTVPELAQKSADVLGVVVESCK